MVLEENDVFEEEIEDAGGAQEDEYDISDPGEESEEIEEPEESKDSEEPEGPDEEQIERAIELGFSMDGAKALKPEELSRILERAEQAAGKQKAEPEDEDNDIPDLDEDEFDEDVVSAWSAMKGEVTRLRKQLNDYEQRARTQENAKVIESFDGLIDGLGDDYHDVFGEGKAKKGSTELENRMEVLREMDFNLTVAKQAGRKMSFEDAFRRSVSYLHPEKTQVEARKNIRRDLERRQTTLTGRPGSRRSKEYSSPEEAAAAKIAEKMRMWNINDED